MNFTEFENIIGYEFKNKGLLKTALTHSSYANEKHFDGECNERLEFLGDSVLGVITAEYFYHNLNHLPEGEMTKKRAACACEKSLYNFAKEINLGKFILLGRGEENTNGRNRASILADAFEAVIAAIFMDGGIEPAKKFILGNLSEEVEIASKNVGQKDFKTVLQEKLQINGDVKIEYTIINENGPDHDKTFEAEVSCNNKKLATGIGKTKKQAEMKAAEKALENM